MHRVQVLRALALVLIACGVPACDRKTADAKPEPSSPSSAKGTGGATSAAPTPHSVDPLKSFESLIPAFFKAGNELAKKRKEVDSYPYVFWLDEKDAKFDVKKTDSLVSPYVAVLETLATASEYPTQLKRHSVTLRFAFQKDRWTLRDGTAAPNEGNLQTDSRFVVTAAQEAFEQLMQN